MRYVFATFLCLRLFMATISWSYLHPDETWQSVEVAHRLVFGNGHLTWEWEQRIRSWLHPLIFAVPLWILKTTGLHCYTDLVVFIPRITQAIISAGGDAFIYAFCHREFGHKVTSWFVILYSCNWCINFHSSRTFINTMEMALTSAALYYYPHGKARRNPSWKYSSLVTFSFAMRSTTALFWMPLAAYDVWRSGLQKPIWELMLPAAAIYIFSTILDSLLYGQITFIHYNFFLINVANGVSKFFGVLPWYWYITAGFLEMFGPVVFLDIFIGCYISFRNARLFKFAFCYIWALICHSLVAHKEPRFILPLVPLTICFIAKSFAVFGSFNPSFGKRNFKLALIILSHVPILIYISMFHGTGTTAAIDYLSKNQNVHSSEIFFLMMGHTTPYYSHIHWNFSMGYPHCGPNFTSVPYSFTDESIDLYEDPVSWLESRDFGKEMFSPTHIVMFNNFPENLLGEYLRIKGYRECANFYNSNNIYLSLLFRFTGRVDAISQRGFATRVLIFCKAYNLTVLQQKYED